MLIIDAHVHLWQTQKGMVEGRPVTALRDGLSDFGGHMRQMMPPYMVDGVNSAEMLIANMNFAQVSAAVVTQESIDGSQNAYLLHAKQNAPVRLKICELYVEDEKPCYEGFDGLKICAGRLHNPDLTCLMAVFKQLEARGMFLSIDLADGDAQTAYMQTIAEECPNLRMAIGHFGMVTRSGWEKQIKLARNRHVYIESGGITWLFHREFYPYPSAVFAIKQAADLCGIEKLMWGSDYPRTMAVITYKMAYDFIFQSKWLNESEKAAFLGENAKRFYGFGNLSIPPSVITMVD